METPLSPCYASRHRCE